MITGIYNRVIMLKGGEIIADGSQKKVLNSKNLKRLYGIDVEVIDRSGFWIINRISK